MTTRPAAVAPPPWIITGMGRGVRTGVGIGLGSLAVPVGIGWFYARVLLDTTIRPMFPERVLAADAETVTLAPGGLALQPGTWGLQWPDGLGAGRAGAFRGPQRRGAAAAGGSAAAGRAGDAGRGRVRAGSGCTRAGVHRRRRGHAAGRRVRRGSCRAPTTPPGPCSSTARGGPRREALRLLPALHALGLPALVVSYRNDPEAPASPDGHYHLGDTEWLDVEAAVAHAIAEGARQVVLVGWSMGAAIIGALLSRSALAARVAALVWDAPLVDWRATLRQQARIRKLPPALTALTTRFAGRRIGIDFDRFDLLAHPPAVRPPTLMIHTAGDTAVPVQPTRALAAAAPALGWPMTYLEVPDAEHTAAWNADPAAYEDAVTRFLARWVA